jgi:hypothetical protein
MFLDTNVTDLLKKKIGVTELIFEKNWEKCDIFGYLVLPLLVIVVIETRLLSEFFLFATRLTMCYNYK